MAYIQASELVTILPNAIGTITGSSTPLTISEVGTICERISVELDSAAAAAGYAVPVSTTATQAFAQMALWNEYGAGAFVLGVLFPNSGPLSQLPIAKQYEDDYRMTLDGLRGGSQPLIGAAFSSDGNVRLLPRSYSTANPGATSGVIAQRTVGEQF